MAPIWELLEFIELIRHMLLTFVRKVNRVCSRKYLLFLQVFIAKGPVNVSDRIKWAAVMRGGGGERAASRFYS